MGLVAPAPKTAAELRAAHRDLAARLSAGERMDAAIKRLMECGPVSQVIDNGPAEAAVAASLDRVLLFRLDKGLLVAEQVHDGGDERAAAALLAALREAPTRLEYPLLELEMIRRRRPLLVEHAGADRSGRPAQAELLGTRPYVAAPVVLQRQVIGYFRGDRVDSAQPPGPLERDTLWTFAQGFALAFERATLYQRLRAQRREMRQVADWAATRSSDLSDGLFDFASDRVVPLEGPSSAASSEPVLRDLLTRRESDVLELMVKGETNAAIARALVVSTGTVKFHVKNILRKLHASNRAEATSRYLRLTLSHRSAANGDSRLERSA